MHDIGYIPTEMKREIIMALHKGGRKSKKKPNNYNYRAITLTSFILKLFELIAISISEKYSNWWLSIDIYDHHRYSVYITVSQCSQLQIWDKTIMSNTNLYMTVNLYVRENITDVLEKTNHIG